MNIAKIKGDSIDAIFPASLQLLLKIKENISSPKKKITEKGITPIRNNFFHVLKSNSFCL